MGNWSDYILKLFQSTLPRRERLPIKSLIPYSFKFQSTLPRRERQLLPKFLTNFQYFNPHSHEGSDTTPGVKDSKLAKFQSTLPRRERQQMERYTRQKHKISIHTPTKGATYIIFMEDITQQISIHTPTKGATAVFPQWNPINVISIHTPTKGATAILTNNFLIFCSISLINFILYLQIIQILFIFRYKFIFYFIF